MTTRESGQPRLMARITVPTEIVRGEPVNVSFELTNGSDEPLRVLQWFTPFEGIAGRIFRVEREGEPVSYRGILVKRGAPAADEYLSIDPRSSVTTEVDLAASYDLTAPGNYRVEFVAPRLSEALTVGQTPVKDPSDLSPLAVVTELVSFQVVERDGEAPRRPPSGAADATYENCTASEEVTVKQSEVTAELQATFVYSHLNGLSAAARQTDALYSKWFGAYTAGRYSTVLNNWKKIKDALDQSRTFNCDGPDCGSSWYAYVYAGGSVEVFLCSKYWSAPESGVDTKFGTLIHEISHEVADTDDNAYGKTACADLATNDPDTAIENADNYEYMAEEYRLPSGCLGAIANLFRFGS